MARAIEGLVRPGSLNKEPRYNRLPFIAILAHYAWNTRAQRLANVVFGFGNTVLFSWREIQLIQETGLIFSGIEKRAQIQHVASCRSPQGDNCVI